MTTIASHLVTNFVLKHVEDYMGLISTVLRCTRPKAPIQRFESKGIGFYVPPV